jgi:hypothetical protein
MAVLRRLPCTNVLVVSQHKLHSAFSNFWTDCLWLCAWPRPRFVISEHFTCSIYLLTLGKQHLMVLVASSWRQVGRDCSMINPEAHATFLYRVLLLYTGESCRSTRYPVLIADCRMEMFLWWHFIVGFICFFQDGTLLWGAGGSWSPHTDRAQKRRQCMHCTLDINCL